MNPNQANTDRNHPDDCQYALCCGVAYRALVFDGREAIFKHELGALYVAHLLLDRPSEPIHAVALALKARERSGRVAEPDEVSQERGMGLEEAAAVRALWRRQRALERVLEDRHESEPVKAEALRELEEITEFLPTSPWLSWDGAERCVGAVTAAIKRFHDPPGRGGGRRGQAGPSATGVCAAPVRPFVDSLRRVWRALPLGSQT